jgi:hypothetical protein
MWVPKSEILLLADIENEKAAMNIMRIEQWLFVSYTEEGKHMFLEIMFQSMMMIATGVD